MKRNPKTKQWLLVSFLLLCVSVFSVRAQSVNLQVNDMRFEQVLSEIRAQTGYTFVYSDQLVDVNQKISVQLKDIPLTEALVQVLKETNLKAEIRNKQIFLVEKLEKHQVSIPKKIIEGVITDASGESVIGANIIVKGSADIGTVTDIDGRFSLEVPEDATLIISYIGFANKELDVKGKTQFNILIKEDSELLDEVVVVGYGVQKKVNLTGSVSTVNYNKELENRPITDASQSLSGKVSGVYVSQNSGAPGSDGSTIRIRGYGSLNGATPLVLIDGVEGRLSELNPTDIASISVLKDAASAAIYGSKAANGVILVETKKGENEKISITYNGYVGLQQLGERYELINNSAEFMDIWNKANINANKEKLFPDEVINAFRTNSDSYKYPNTDWFDEVFRTSVTTQHNLSVSYGTKKSKTYLSLGYLKNNGIIKNTDSERYNLTINTEVAVNENIKIGGRMRMMHKDISQPYNGIGRVIMMIANGYPFATPYLEDGTTYGGSQALYLSGSKKGEPIVDTRNPFPDLYNGSNEFNNTFMKASTYISMDLFKGINFMAQYTYQYNQNVNDRYNEVAYSYTDIGVNKTKPLDYATTLTMYRGGISEMYSNFYANLNYNKTIEEKHDIALLLGYQQEGTMIKTLSGAKNDPPKSGIHQIDAGTSNPTISGNKNENRMISYFGRLNYAYDQKYLAEVNLRADASSRFAKGNRWGIFPSLSGAWRLSEEKFITNLNLFDNLKLRASWGELGNQNVVGNFPYLAVISQNNKNSYNYNSILAPGAAKDELVDPSITWETTATINMGIDMGLFNNRLTLELDYFDKKTRDILVQLPIPELVGVLTAPMQNIGKMRNQGFEINIGWKDHIQSTDFTYRLNLNMSAVKNKVVKFKGGKSPDQLYLIREGHSYKALYGYLFDGIYQSDEEANEHMKNNGYKPVAGDIRYKDVNNDGKLDYRDKQEIGNTIPRLTYGLNGELSWRKFDLNFQFSGITGVTGYIQNQWTEPLSVSGGSITKRWRNAWTQENKSQDLPHIRVNDTWNRQNSSFWASDMSWFKLKNIQLGYSFDKEQYPKLLVERLYLYLNATDVFTLVGDKYEGFDPERNTFDSGYNHYPIPQIFTIGINLTL